MGKWCRQRGWLLMMAVVALLLTSCASVPPATPNHVLCDANSVGYCQELAAFDRPVEGSDQSWLSRSLAAGAAVEVFEVQAHRALRAGMANSWRADFLTTAVIIVDRDATDAQITGWADLAEAGQPVAITRAPADSWLLLAAIEWGLNGQLVPDRAAFELIAQLRRTGLLLTQAAPAAITIGFDHQAADRLAAGENLQVIVPTEGTLSFVKGLTSAAEALPASTGLAGHLAARGYAAPDAEPPVGAQLVAADEMPYDAGWVAKYRREGLGENRLHIADRLESIVVTMLASILLIGWLGSFARRGSQPSVRRAAIGIGTLAVFWLVVRMFRYETDHPLAAELLWYCYYVALLGMPLLMLWLAWAVDRAIDNGRPPQWWWLLLGVDLALLALVLTNSLHRLVFSFPPGEPYRYEPGYYVIAAACGLPMLVAIGWLSIKSRRLPGRRYRWAPIAVVLVMAGYLVAYALRVPLLHQTDLTLTVIFFGVLLIESAVRARTLPLNRNYGALFEAATLNMRIVEASSGAELAAAGSLPADAAETNLVEFSAPISGGKVVWTQDISAISALQISTSQAVQRLRALNEMLQARHEVEREVVAAGVRARLLAEMETEVGARVAALDNLVSELPPGPVARHSLARIGLRACFVKRRAALFFQLQSGEAVSGDEMLRLFVELVGLIEPAGVGCAVQLPDDPTLVIAHPEVLYECVFRLLDHAVANQSRAMVVRVDEQPASQRLSCLLPVDFFEFSFDADLLARLAGLAAEISWRRVDESVALVITLPTGQEADDA